MASRGVNKVILVGNLGQDPEALLNLIYLELYHVASSLQPRPPP